MAFNFDIPADEFSDLNVTRYEDKGFVTVSATDENGNQAKVQVPIPQWEQVLETRAERMLERRLEKVRAPLNDREQAVEDTIKTLAEHLEAVFSLVHDDVGVKRPARGGSSEDSTAEDEQEADAEAPALEDVPEDPLPADAVQENPP